MNLIILVVIVFILFIFFKLKVKPKQESENFEHSYERLDVLFTPAERSFFGVLNQAISDDVIAFGKVRVADAITPTKGGVKGAWQRAFNKISAKHFDFVLCNKSDLSFVCGIELDDKSHNSEKQKSRDAFLESACKSADFPLIRFPAKSTYSVNDIRESLSVCFSEFQEKALLLAATELETSKKLCPKCSSEMHIKVAKKGKSIGSEFWACSGYPKCRHIEPIKI
ncbi:MAG: ssDNA-binding Zn-finger/Zn-ribbon topoisomerase 1 [Psychromonas sp.]|uniref:DUF2726 domain-containing protein n=1 Tax=Psychromonas sp. TaxID=1884585 RepID=UPI0039E64F46